MSLLNIPHQTQIEPSWCLPPCAAMVCAYWGQPLYQGDIARWLRTTGTGTPARNIGRLREHGFNVAYLEGSFELLVNSLGQGIPCIVFIRTGELPYWSVDTAHAVVLAGLDGEQAYVFDPTFADAPKTTTVETFMLAWSFFDYTVATLTPITSQ